MPGDLIELIKTAKEVFELVSCVLPTLPNAVAKLDVDRYSLALTRVEHTSWAKNSWVYQYQPNSLIGPTPSFFTQVVSTGTVGSATPTYTSSSKDSFDPHGIGRQNRICDYSTVAATGEIDPLKFSLSESFTCRLTATMAESSIYLDYLGGYANFMVSFKEGLPASTCTGPGTNPSVHYQDDIGPISIQPAVVPPLGNLPQGASVVIFPSRTNWEHIWWDSSKPFHGYAAIRLLSYGTPK